MSNRNKLEQCIIGATSIEKDKKFINKSTFLKNHSTSFRSLGSAALDLAFVASGKLDAFWGNDLNIWDIASGIILVIEAGGAVTTPDLNKWDISSRNVIASNSHIHNKIANI